MFETTKPGTTSRQLIETATDPVTQVPLVVVQGTSEGPILLVTAGIHGAEYASIEAANRVAATDPQHLNGTLVVLPVVNRPSFEARSIYINPIDRKNLNRVFPGDQSGSFAEQLAYWLTNNFIARSGVYIDLHGGDLNEALTPFVIHHRDDQEARALAKVFGIPNIIASHSSGGHTYDAGHAHGVPSLLAEAGGQGLFPEDDIYRLTNGVERVLQHMEMLPGAPPELPTTRYEQFAWLRSSFSGYWYLEIGIGDTVVAQQRVGVVKDLLGQVVQEAFSPVNGKVLFAVSSLAINEGDPLVGIGAK